MENWKICHAKFHYLPPFRVHFHHSKLSRVLTIAKCIFSCFEVYQLMHLLSFARLFSIAPRLPPDVLTDGVVCHSTFDPISADLKTIPDLKKRHALVYPSRNAVYLDTNELVSTEVKISWHLLKSTTEEDVCRRTALSVSTFRLSSSHPSTRR